MMEYLKPLPLVDDVSRPFWIGCRRKELLLQKCDLCGRFRFYPRPLCPHCFSEQAHWVKASGRGAVYSYTVTHQNLAPGFAEEVPYVLAIVELEEGVRMTSNIVGCRPEEVSIGMSVQAVFQWVSLEITLPKFAPAPPPSR